MMYRLSWVRPRVLVLLIHTGKQSADRYRMSKLYLEFRKK